MKEQEVNEQELVERIVKRAGIFANQARDALSVIREALQEPQTEGEGERVGAIAAIAEIRQIIGDNGKVMLSELPGAVRKRIEALESKIADAYQFAGNVLEHAGLFEHPEGQRALDYFAHETYEEGFLPWPREDLIQTPKAIAEAEARGIEKERSHSDNRHWHNGEPPKPQRNEWFIAETIHGDRVVLKALPEDWTYDYKTADDTYLMARNIKRWMRFPDSHFIEPAAAIRAGGKPNAP